LVYGDFIHVNQGYYGAKNKGVIIIAALKKSGWIRLVEAIVADF